MKNKAYEILKAYHEECQVISDQCVEEGYPSHGENYDLRCEALWRDYYEPEYEAATASAD